MTPWLSQQEIDDLCEPLKQPAAQIRFLRDSLKLAVKAKPNGRALVLRTNVEDVLAGLPVRKKKHEQPARTPAQPNAAGLVVAFRRG